MLTKAERRILEWELRMLRYRLITAVSGDRKQEQETLMRDIAKVCVMLGHEPMSS
jgi:hypothetical protein